MKNLLIFTILLSLACFQVNAQVLTNGYFNDSNCSNNSTAFQSNCVPHWSRSHGSPSISSANGANRSAWMYSYAGQSEGIKANYDFNAGCTYKIYFKVHTSDKGSDAPSVANARAYIKMANGVPNSGGLSVPSVSSQQTIFNGRVGNYYNGWTTESISFTPNSNYSQLWIYPYLSTNPINNGQVEFQIDNIYINLQSENNDPSFYMSATGNTNGNVSVYVSANSTPSNVSHQFDVFYAGTNGSTAGNTQVPGNPAIYNTSGTFYNNLETNTWYYVKHGVWSDCSSWREKRSAFKVSLKKGTSGKTAQYEIVYAETELAVEPTELETETELTETELPVIKESPTAALSVSVYPNPTTVGDRINVQSDESIRQVEMFDLTGRKIGITPSINGGDNASFTIENNLTPGLYFIKVINEDDSVHTEKLIVQ